MSQPEPSEPGSLDEAGQQQLIQQIGRVIVQSLPPGWHEAGVEYRAVGSHSELAAQLVAPNGTLVPLSPPTDVAPMFDQLRHGMHQQDRGTWISALYRLQRPSSYSVDFNGDYEPTWRTAPDSAQFAEELRRYPRAADNVPTWMTERAEGRTPTNGAPVDMAPSEGAPAEGAPAEGAPNEGEASADVPVGALRTAEVFDDADSAGRPITDRPEVSPTERDRLLEYLEQAPVVLAAHSYDTDQLDPRGAASVPLTFHTDGSWIWPAAVGYYLRTHAVPPQADLVAHIREQGFQLPAVDERARQAAASAITAEQGR